MSRSTDRAAARECPRCAEIVAEGASECSFCGYEMRPRKSASTRLLEVLSLAAVLGVIVGVCSLLGKLLGV